MEPRLFSSGVKFSLSWLRRKVPGNSTVRLDVSHTVWLAVRIVMVSGMGVWARIGSTDIIWDARHVYNVSNVPNL